MKTYKIYYLLLILFIFNSCEEDDAIAPLVIISYDKPAFTSIEMHGIINEDGGASITERGFCWSTVDNPTITNNKVVSQGGTDEFSATIQDLSAGQCYYVRAYAINSEGVGYSSTLPVYTLESLVPSVATMNVTKITEHTIVADINIISENGDEITEQGVCWSSSTEPEVTDNKYSEGKGTGIFTLNLSGLNTNTEYYLRAYAINSKGIGYGNTLSFITKYAKEINFNNDLNYGTVTDIDGNSYKTIEIGTQTWMSENLKVTKYNDGAPIPLVTNNKDWAYLESDAYCWYNNDTAYKSTFGALYNFYTVQIDKVCPEGWHVSTEKDWSTLFEFIGGADLAGSKLKEAGYTHWRANDSTTTNQFGLTLMSGGIRPVYFVTPDHNEHYGEFVREGVDGYYWMKEITPKYSQFTYKYPNATLYLSSVPEGLGMSVRCVKD